MRMLTTETAVGAVGETLLARLALDDDGRGSVEVVSATETRRIFRFQVADLQRLCREFLSTPRPRIEAYLDASVPQSWDWFMGFWRSTEELQLVSSLLSFCENLHYWAGNHEALQSLSGGIRDNMARPNWLYVPNEEEQRSLSAIAEDGTAIGERLFQMGLLYRVNCTTGSEGHPRYFVPYNLPIIRSSLLDGEARRVWDAIKDSRDEARHE